MSSFRPCALIPVYNHERAVRKVIDRLLPLNLEIIMVDDGSSKACAQVLDALAQEYGSLLHLMHLAQNGGKGAACIAGFRKAQELGFTHALQVDADAQHDLGATAGFLRAAQDHPQALVCAYPEYDSSAPAARRWGHKVTNFWVALNTWGRGPDDALCGFRVYPLSETISVVFFQDQGLARSQQMFTDLNKHAVKTSNSIAELYDSRDPLAVITRNIVSQIKFLNAYTDKEKDILGKYSSNLFTLSTFYNANKRILRGGTFTKTGEEFLFNYWNGVCQNIQPWRDLQNHEVSKVDLRENYIVTQSVIIQVFGRLGAFFFNNKRYQVNKYLPKLQKVNWRRDCADWKLRTIRANGRMINNEEAITLTCNVLKKRLGLPFDEFEQGKERPFTDRM